MKKIINKNNFFLFWNFKNNGSSLTEFTNILESLSLSTIWLKQGVFSSLYLNNTNLKLKALLRSQSFFSYGEIENINFSNLVKNFDTYKQDLVLLGIILNDNLFLDSHRFKLVKSHLKHFNGSINALYLLFLRKVFVYYVLNRLLWFKLLYIQLYKKNFTLLK